MKGRAARSSTVALALAVGSGCGSDDGGRCDACGVTIVFSGTAGIPVDADAVTVAMCGGDACVEVSISVPQTVGSAQAGDEPSLTVSVERTDEPYYQDLQGVFQLDATWASTSRRLNEGSLVSFSVTAPDGGNVFSTLRTLDVGETDACGCGTIMARATP